MSERLVEADIRSAVPRIPQLCHASGHNLAFNHSDFAVD